MPVIGSTRHRNRKIKWMLDLIEYVNKRRDDVILKKNYFFAFHMYLKDVLHDTFNNVDGVYTRKSINDLHIRIIEDNIRKMVTQWDINPYYLDKPGDLYAKVREVDKFLQLLNVMIMRFDDEKTWTLSYHTNKYHLVITDPGEGNKDQINTAANNPENEDGDGEFESYVNPDQANLNPTTKSTTHGNPRSDDTDAIPIQPDDKKEVGRSQEVFMLLTQLKTLI